LNLSVDIGLTAWTAYQNADKEVDGFNTQSKLIKSPSNV
jgi:hypothetical protein